MRRFTYQEVVNFVNENSNCELLEKEYKNQTTKMSFKCECGETFITTFEKFRTRGKRQCNNCGRKILTEKNKLSYKEVKKYIEENSNCKLLSKDYVSTRDKILLQCECGKEFWVAFRHFRSSNQRQCQECGNKIRSNKRKLDFSYIENFVKENSECKLLSDKYINSNHKLDFECKCGNKFSTYFDLFKKLDIRMCAKCRQSVPRSKGELKISEWLYKNNINYKEEYTFDDLKDIKKLRFDFAVLNDKGEVKMLIEFDGKQHQGEGVFAKAEEEVLLLYNELTYSDNLKNEYCFNKCIPLLRIPYDKYAYIDEILARVLK